MIIREYSNEKDFEKIQNWITDERMHAMWCANLTPYPLSKEGLEETLKTAASKFGDVPFLALTDDKEAAGFFCYSKNSETNEGMLKFVVVNPAYRGKGIAKEMLEAAAVYAFEDTKADALQLNVFPENERAKKCYLKAGFTERNTTENAFIFKDESWGRCNMVLRKNKEN
jgi:RimJ/RimL family protein N-acetyltransferase